MKYNVGDKVRIKSIDWYNSVKDEFGYVSCETYQDCSYYFENYQTEWCGKIMTISYVCDGRRHHYIMKEDSGEGVWTDEMIDCLAEEDFLDMLDNEINLPEGYEFRDEKDNIINVKKIVLSKKKPKYPKTFLECCDVLNIENLIERGVKGYKAELFDTLQKLLICRDAYWKIAGEEMGLGKPWEPDWDNLSTNHEFIKINKGCFTYSSRVLVFPTEEIRDAFYEAFKELIEECKELL